MTTELKVSRRDTTLILTFVNPGQKNALDHDMLAAAIEIFSKAERDDTIRSVILSGADRNFCSGIQSGKDRALQMSTLENLQNLIETLRGFPKPVLAAVEGIAFDAGFSLALACDLIIAGQNASFGISPAQVGIWAIGGAVWLLPKILPPQCLAEILLDAKPVSAMRLHTAAVVNKLVSDGSVQEEALVWAGQLSGTAPAAFEQLKALLDKASDNTLREHFAWEKQALLTQRH